MKGFEIKDIELNIGGSQILSAITFEQPLRQKLAIVGESGAGKSSLLKIMGSYGQATGGSIFFNGQKVFCTAEQLIPGHASIAYLSQDHELRNNYWVHEILSYANTLSHPQAMHIYKTCRVDHLLNRRTNIGLSGGEKQRLSLARLLTASPQHLLLDEPFSSLDNGHKNILRQVLHDVHEQLGVGITLVSHDGGEVLQWADEVLVLKKGNVVQKGLATKVYYQPADLYTAAIFGHYSLVPQHWVSAYSGIHIMQEQAFLRPAQISLHTMPEKGAIKALVQEQLFYGAYSIYVLSIQGHHCLATAAPFLYKPGTEVYVQFLEIPAAIN